MSLAIGLVLGPYRVVAKLGAGGMGEVYRARDQRLGRDVALKILRAGAMRDTELRRLVQEASAAGRLNHPNIVAVYDVNLDAETPYIVAELVDGESLHQAIRRGLLPVRTLIEIAVQIAGGLTAAHEASVVHRDLKPANILLTRDGVAKIADFGLAKDMASTEGHSREENPTISLSHLQLVQGTAEYMSPEQARGQPVDTRSDIFSFGLILYEMASGRRPFSRDSAIETLEAIINAEAEPLADRIPDPLRWSIERCLAKKARDRYNSTRDLYNDLRGIQQHLSGATTSTIPVSSAKRRRFSAPVWGSLGLLGGLVAGGIAAALWFSSDWPDPGKVRFRPLATSSAWEDWAAWSPQGDQVAYYAMVDNRPQVFTRGLQSPDGVQITNCPTGCDRPVWSPDGRQLFVRTRGGIAEVGAAGGAERPVVPDAEALALSPDGKTLAFIRRNADLSGISVWTASPPSAPPVHYQPAPFEGVETSSGLRIVFTPDGKGMLIWARFYGRGSEFWMLPYPAATGAPYRVMAALKDAYPVRGFDWLPGGRRLVLAAALPPNLFKTHLYAADLASGEVRRLVGGIGSEAWPAVSPDGRRIAYTAMDFDADIVAIPLDGGAPHDLIATNSLEHSPAWSPTGQELAYVTDRTGVDEIWVRNMATGRELPVVTPRSFEGGQAEFLDSPVFSPDGQRIAFVRHNRENAQRREGTEIWLVPASGGAPIALTKNRPGAQWAPSWSPDGKSIAFIYQGPPSGLMKILVGGGEPPETIWPMDISVSVSNLGSSAWSPRGDWIAVPAKAGVMLVSPDGKNKRLLRKPAFGAMVWSNDGALLYGREDADSQRIVAVDVATGRERLVTRIPPSMNLSEIWAPSQEIRLSRDGKILVATRIRHTGDIWLLENFQPPSFFDRLFHR
jgi:eukaryotic-like serine/threonine-protein kinase